MNNLLKIIIGLSGIFFFKSTSIDRFYPAQYMFFIFSIGLLFSYLIYKKDNIIGCISFLCSAIFLKTFIMQQTSNDELIKFFLLYFSIFLIYFFTRYLNLKEDILKFFIIPSCLNAGLIIIQAFDSNFLPFMPINSINKISGFLGHPGTTSCYLAITTPIFFKYFKKGLPFIIIAVLLCKSFTGLLAILLSSFIYLYYTEDKIRIKKIIISIMLFFTIFSLFNINKIEGSLSIRKKTILGVLSGIKENPILGWGLGSYEPIMTKIAFDNNPNMSYLRNFSNNVGGIMRHPHNELLFGWWNFGILFPVLMIIYVINIIKNINKEKIMLLSILIAGGVCSMFYFFSPPVWFLIIISLGIYNNKESEYADKKT